MTYTRKDCNKMKLNEKQLFSFGTSRTHEDIISKVLPKLYDFFPKFYSEIQPI